MRTRSFLLFFIPIAIFAIDSSYDTSSDNNVRLDTSISVKRSQDIRDSKRQSTSKSRTASGTTEVGFDTYPIYFTLADKCIKNPKTVLDFDLTSVSEPGVIDLTLGEYYDQLAKNNQPIKLAGMNETEFKKYLACISLNGARMAQANLNFAGSSKGVVYNPKSLRNVALKVFKTTKPSSPFITAQLGEVAKSLKNSTCVFMGTSTMIKCGSVIYDFNAQQLKDGTAFLYGANEIFGVSSSFKVSVNDSVSITSETSHEESKSRGRDIGITQTDGTQESESSKDSMGIREFFPSFQ